MGKKLHWGHRSCGGRQKGCLFTSGKRGRKGRDYLSAFRFAIQIIISVVSLCNARIERALLKGTLEKDMPGINFQKQNMVREGKRGEEKEWRISNTLKTE
ncbi:hypothetical protein TNCT_525141 [Trichonephila clavata]|uniref:Uncharacterized protein n=1 Tax=Trichonephila clavata TaxID=2740835 RepID=A0A8X6GI72_TRICU|nr:hypothetical protein TNCT_525141 [Trichonephila clavata]